MKVMLTHLSWFNKKENELYRLTFLGRRSAGIGWGKHLQWVHDLHLTHTIRSPGIIEVECVSCTTQEIWTESDIFVTLDASKGDDGDEKDDDEEEDDEDDDDESEVGGESEGDDSERCEPKRAQWIPHALHKSHIPLGPRRHNGVVDVPQCAHRPLGFIAVCLCRCAESSTQFVEKDLEYTSVACAQQSEDWMRNEKKNKKKKRIWIRNDRNDRNERGVIKVIEECKKY